MRYLYRYVFLYVYGQLSAIKNLLLLLLHLIPQILQYSKDVLANSSYRVAHRSQNGSNYDSLIVRTVAFPVQVAYWI